MQPSSPWPSPPRRGDPELSQDEFDRLARLARERYGLDLPERKRSMVAGRLAKLRRETGISSVQELLRRVEDEAAEGDRLVLFDALSTNLTHFFREREHLDLLADELAAAPLPRRLRIWSAGCSKGCEPFSIVMTLLDRLPDLVRADFKLLATDYAVSVLGDAREARYPEEMLRDLPQATLQRHFEAVEGGHRVRDHVRSRVTFALLNLMEPWRMRGPFDAIFCRNVMIYFDAPTREALTRRFTGLLRPGGLLFLGSSESLTGNHPELLRVAPTAFRKS